LNREGAFKLGNLIWVYVQREPAPGRETMGGTGIRKTRSQK